MIAWVKATDDLTNMVGKQVVMQLASEPGRYHRARLVRFDATQIFVAGGARREVSLPRARWEIALEEISVAPEDEALALRHQVGRMLAALRRAVDRDEERAAPRPVVTIAEAEVEFVELIAAIQNRPVVFDELPDRSGVMAMVFLPGHGFPTPIQEADFVREVQALAPKYLPPWVPPEPATRSKLAIVKQD